MKIGSPIRRLAVASLLLGKASWLSAQAPPAKPSAAVMALPEAQPTTRTVQTTPVAAQTNPHRIDVQYLNGTLAVQATNASLNEILREVSKKTGIKLTGGVADDRVFGSYGPSKPADVLDALLQGTGSNMLLVNDVKGRPELILTPRRGSSSAPNTSVTPNTDRNETEDTGSGAYVPPVRPYQPPVANGRGPIAEPDANIIPLSSSEEDNGTNTPQQIYEQLQRTMQQNQANNPPQ